jgi:hypothetical protein
MVWMDNTSPEEAYAAAENKARQIAADNIFFIFFPSRLPAVTERSRVSFF